MSLRPCAACPRGTPAYCMPDRSATAQTARGEHPDGQRGEMAHVSRLNRAVGLLRSLWIYHGIPGRRARLLAFYRPLVPPGGLAFDIGAHMGNRTLAWRRLGARVVAVEPQPDCLRVLRWLLARDAAVTVLPLAVGQAEGEAQLLKTSVESYKRQRNYFIFAKMYGNGNTES